MADFDITELTEAQRKQSVTADEQKYSSMNFYLMPFLYARPMIVLPPDPPTYWTFQRDIVLRSTPNAETMWASALGIAITKMQSAGWKVEGTQRKVSWAHDLLSRVEFLQGWRFFIARHGQDFLTCDNGAFVEIIRASKGPGSKIVGLAHLDSLRCRRTGDDEIPIVYRDFIGAEHEMHAHQVFSVVDLPDAAATMRGVGHCAASRAYQSIYKLSNIERYIAEKASGRRPLALHLVSNVSLRQIQDAMLDAQREADKKGMTTYMGAAVIPTNSDQTPGLLTIPFAEIPDGVNVEQERNDTYLRYADAIGLDPQELQPLTGRAMGTATQSMVLDEKERGKFGWFASFAEQINLHRIVGGATVFAFSEKDWRDQQLEAQVKQTRAATRAAQITSTEITADQARQMAADAGDIPKEFLAIDATDNETIFDTDNPDAEEAQEAEAQAAGQQLPAPPNTPPEATTAPNLPPNGKTGPTVPVTPKARQNGGLGLALRAVQDAMRLKQSEALWGAPEEVGAVPSPKG